MAADRRPFVGELSIKVQIHRVDVVKNSVNERIETPVLMYDTWAKAYSNSGTEETDLKVEHNSRSVYIIRSRPDLVQTKKLTLTDTTTGVKYEVVHVEKLRRSHLIINCKAFE